MGYYTFLLCAILSIFYFCYDIIFVKELDIECWFDEKKDTSSNLNSDGTHSDSKTGINLHDAEKDNSLHDKEKDNNIHDPVKENNLNDEENECLLNDEEKENNIDEGENNFAVCI